LSKVVEQTATNRLELSVSAGTDAQNALSDDAVSSKYCYGTEFSCGTAHGQGPDLRSIARDMPVLVRERDAISLADKSVRTVSTPNLYLWVCLNARGIV
jgi:hypothetical protein